MKLSDVRVREEFFDRLIKKNFYFGDDEKYHIREDSQFFIPARFTPEPEKKEEK